MSGFSADIKLDFDNAALITLTNKVCDAAAKKGVDKVLADSKTYLKANTKHGHGETGLAGEIKLEKSKFKGGGWAIEAQGPNNYKRYYAVFVELGHRSSMFGRYSRKKGNIGSSPVTVAPIPYLRNPLKANKQYIINLFKDLI